MLTKEEKPIHIYQSISSVKNCCEKYHQEVWRDPHSGEQRQEEKDFKNFGKKTSERGF